MRVLHQLKRVQHWNLPIFIIALIESTRNDMWIQLRFRFLEKKIQIFQ